MEPHTRLSSQKYSPTDFFQDIDSFKHRFCKQNGMIPSRTTFLKINDNPTADGEAGDRSRRHVTYAVYVDQALFCHLDFIDSAARQIDVFTMSLS